MLGGVVLTAIATFLLKEAKHEVEIEERKLSISAYALMKWLLEIVDNPELRDFRNKQLALKEQRRLEYQLKVASESRISVKMVMAQSRSEASKDSLPETVSPMSDREPCTEAYMRLSQAGVATSAKCRAPFSDPEGTSKQCEARTGTSSSSQLSLKEVRKPSTKGWLR